MEAIIGGHLHKQNFRRLVESGGLVEETGDVRTATGGRPAKVYRFRREALMERPGAWREGQVRTLRGNSGAKKLNWGAIVWPLQVDVESFLTSRSLPPWLTNAPTPQGKDLLL